LAASDPFAATVASADTANNIPVSVGVQNEAATGSPYTNYSDQQMAQYIQQQGINTSDPAALAAAEQATNADPAAVQAFLASGADPYSAQSLANPAQSNVSSFDAQLGTKGATTDINNAVYAAQLAAGVPGGTSNSITANTQIANEMDNWNVDPASMANAVGMTPEAIQALYNQVDPNGKFSTLPKTQVINTPGNSGGGGGGGGGTGPVTNVTTSTPINTAPASTLKPGVSGNTGPAVTGGGTVVNANGTITESPVLPGIPQGGFTGMQNLLDTYTKGGGSTGYVSPTVSSMDEFNSKYNTLSGGTKAAYNYLMGQGNYPIAPSSSTGQVMKPYSESVLGIPQSATIPDTQKYYVDSTTHMLTLNPKYNPASTNSGSGVGNTASTSGATGNSLVGTSINVNGGKAVYDPVSGYYLINGQYYNADGTPSGYNPSSGATGGLMGMAHGGHIKRYAGNAGSLVNNASEAYENSNLNEEGEYQNDPLEAFYKTVPSSVMRTPAGAGLAAALYSPTLNRGEQDQLDMIRQQMHSPTSQYAGGRMRHTMSNMAHGGMADDSYNLGGYSDGGRLLRGPGDGVSDDIPATIGHKQPARLADGEFVVPARIVSELGNGSTEAGAKQLYAMMDRVQKARGKTVGKNKVATNTKAAKYLPA